MWNGKRNTTSSLLFNITITTDHFCSFKEKAKPQDDQWWPHAWQQRAMQQISGRRPWRHQCFLYSKLALPRDHLLTTDHLSWKTTHSAVTEPITKDRTACLDRPQFMAKWDGLSWQVTWCPNFRVFWFVTSVETCQYTWYSSPPLTGTSLLLSNYALIRQASFGEREN